jgi:hypothetical protein
MGCLGIEVIDEETSKILATLDLKVEEYKKTFETNVEKVKKKQEDQLKARHDTLSELKEKNEEITEKTIRKLNGDELKVEIDILSNILDKMHYIFEIGLSLVEPLRKVTLDKLIEKSKTAPAITVNKIKSQIEEIEKIPVLDFLKSTHGKVLKNALEKKGMSVTILKSAKKDLFKERGERRKAEREEFGIKVNEFEDEDIDKIKFDLYDLVEEEYKGFDQIYREHVREKMVENYYQKIYG